jgi:uncharacterized protein
MVTDVVNVAARREVISIPTADGGAIEAWVYAPSGKGPHPAVVMVHGMGAIKACGLAAFAERFCHAGFVAIAIDYRHWGGSSGEPRDILFYSKQREDCRTAIDWAAANPRIDSERIFLWGTSFAGMHVVEIAASNARLAGAIALCPLVDSIAGAGTIPVSHVMRLFALALWDKVRSLFGASPIYVPLSVRAGEWGMLASDDAYYSKKLVEPKDGTVWRNRLAARSLLSYLGARPVKKASAIRCPILLIIGEQDFMVPAEAIKQVAASAPESELHFVPGGHADGFAGGIAHDRVLALQVDFLQSHANKRWSGLKVKLREHRLRS